MSVVLIGKTVLSKSSVFGSSPNGHVMVNIEETLLYDYLSPNILLSDKQKEKAQKVFEKIMELIQSNPELFRVEFFGMPITYVNIGRNYES